VLVAADEHRLPGCGEGDQIVVAGFDGVHRRRSRRPEYHRPAAETDVDGDRDDLR
jgi:hypothetical protein